MNIDSLPYLLQLIKSNIILHILVSTGSFQGIDLENVDHDIMGSGIQFYNFSLSAIDTFDVLFFVQKDTSGNKTDSIIKLILTTKDSKYFDNADYYFNDDENKGKNKNPLIKEQRKIRKDLGAFKLFDSPVPTAFVSVIRNPAYGYGIFLSFYSNFEEVFKRREAMDKLFEQNPP